ncbi:MAG TPA: WD40 repeat domain-containing protein [Ktedonobacterales bacterium]|nr:WD40 repeat domain-containing protein [Ktedonobacterales bacterium]
MKRIITALIPLLLAAFLLPGCGGTTQPSGPPSLIFPTTTPSPAASSGSTKEAALQLARFPGSANMLAWSPDGTRLAVMIEKINQGVTVEVWDATTGKQLSTYSDQFADGCCLAWSPDGKQIAVAVYPILLPSTPADPNTIRILDAATGTLLRAFDQDTNQQFTFAHALSWVPDGAQLELLADTQSQPGLTNATTVVVQSWDALTGKLLSAYPAPLQSQSLTYINAVAWSPDGKKMAASGTDGKVLVWDATTGQVLLTYSGHTNTVFALVWSPDGRFLASGSADTTVQVWDATTGKLVYRYQGHANEVHSLAWSPDSKRVVSGSSNSSNGPEEHPIQLWDAFTGQHVFAYSAESDPATALGWSPDGTRIASASASLTENGAIQIWTPPSESD